jgi:hypothetical protein
MCDVCPPSELDSIITVLLSVFDDRDMMLALIKALIDKEISMTKMQAEFFRGSTPCTRFIAAFAKIHGHDYLQKLVRPLISTMENAPAGFEMASGRDDITENRRSIEYVAQAFLQIIGSSVPILPS